MSGRFGELVFGNVNYVDLHYYGNGEVDVYGPADPDTSWSAYVRLSERADLVRLRTASRKG
jgi:hypothetical protein